MDTLILNADATPLSIVPLSAVNWQDAVKAVFLGSVSVLHTYEDWTVRSPSTEIAVPAVLMLKQHVTYKWRLRYSSRLVFLRDDHQCQYCGQHFQPDRLTIDHVLPRHHGGRTKWENVVAACSPCNVKRGHDVRIRPLREPWRPSYFEMVKLVRKSRISVPHESWIYYLGWPDDRITLRKPRTIVLPTTGEGVLHKALMSG
jgi:5-methylcytosine-specific restriction endonuclease McrA